MIAAAGGSLNRRASLELKGHFTEITTKTYSVFSPLVASSYVVLVLFSQVLVYLPLRVLPPSE